MKISLFIIFILMNIGMASQISASQATCTCAQLYVQKDCVSNSSSCQWNTTTSACETKSTDGTGNGNNTPVPTYCDQFAQQTTCAADNSCAWIDTKCIAFTGCTVYQKTTVDDCQTISNKCVTDGTNCVDIDVCTKYLTSTSCLNEKDSNICYWDTTTITTGQCITATLCSQLPSSYTTDDQCRNGLASRACTVQSSGQGCVDSGTDCKDQGIEIQCKWNKAYVQPCFWNSTACIDKLCANAPSTSSYSSDAQCIQFGGQNCTTNGAGCVTRANCSDAKVKAACTTNSTNGQCYWNVNSTTTKCLDLSCINLDPTFATNTACQSDSRLTTCITTGKGCTIDINCGSATVQQACESNRKTGLTCYWNGTSCVTKTCENASTTDYNIGTCSTYLPTCTGYSSKGGCQTKSCDNAPTGTDCPTWTTAQNCIAKKAGGCVAKTTCDVIDVEIACVTDQNGKDCYWNSTDQKCYSWSCSTITTSDCPNQNGKCIINNGSCVNYTCPNALKEEDCSQDKDGQKCKYNNGCYQKQCSLSTATDQTGCNNYLTGQCIINKDATRCIEIPNLCSQIENPDACKIRKDGGKCALTLVSSGTCTDLQCNLVPIQAASHYTVSLCGQQLSGCVPSSDGTSCQVLATSCEGRDNQLACTAEGSSLTKCAWDSTSSPAKCYTKTCALATKDSGYNVSTITLATDCSDYKPDPTKTTTQCAVGSATGTLVCIDAPTDCTKLGQLSCTDAAFASLGCYWSTKATASCVSKSLCSNLYETTSEACYTVSNGNCTHPTNDGSPQNCVNAQSQCTNYTSTPAICEKGLTKTKVKCTYSGSACTNAKCSALSQLTETTDANCYALSPLCTIATTPNVICQIKGTTCNSFKSQQACETFVLGGKTQCTWASNACSNAASFTCSSATGTDLTWGYCQNLSNTCSVNVAKNACIEIQATCGGYTDTLATDCVWAVNDKYCYNNGTACVKAEKCYQIPLTNAAACAQAKAGCTWKTGDTTCSYDCSGFTAGPFSYDTCNLYNAECAIKRDGTGCFGMTKTCATIASGDINSQCTQGTDGPCKYTSGSPSTCALYTSTGTSNLETTSTCVNLALTGTAKWFTPTYCLAISGDLCQAKVSGQGCYAIVNGSSGTCAQQATTDCVGIGDGTKCTFDDSNPDPANHACADNTDCTTVKLSSGSLSAQICALFGCTFSSPSCADGPVVAANTPTSPAAPACSDYTGISLTHNICQNFKLTCTVNVAKTFCIDIQDTCNLYTDLGNCTISKNEGVCVVDGTSCKQKDCSGAAPSDNTAALCQTYNSNCTAKETKCIERAVNCVGLPQAQCYYNSSLQKCYWDSQATPASCLSASACSNAPAAAYFITHAQCQNFSPNCTSKIAKAPTQGCENLQISCNSYLNEAACKITTTNANCYWDNVASQCINAQSCQTAPTLTNTHTACQLYQPISSLLGTCTVNVYLNGTTETSSSCISLLPCQSYEFQPQCKLSSEKNSSGGNIQCEWNATAGKCFDKGCNSADDTYTTADSCYNTYGDKCTVQIDGTGCTDIPDSCIGMTEKQCKDPSGFTPFDKAGNKCYWSSSNLCAIRTCANASDSGISVSSTTCATFLGVCTFDDSTPFCKNDICENYFYDNDTACKAVVKTDLCTTNGTYCVTRTTCEKAAVESACNKNSNNKECQWIAATNTVPGYCVTKSCTTAPTSFNTEAACKGYWSVTSGPICTTKQGGGCVLKGSCSSITTSDACSSDSSNIPCYWDSENTTTPCRAKVCSDITSSSFATCQQNTFQGSKCILGSGNKCKNNDKCSTITVAAGCIKGTDGPCYWVADSTQTNGGTCYPYTSCQSVASTTFEYCQKVSKNCTTDGTNCIGLTQCTKTDTDGCFLGTDGNCVLTATSLTASDSSCKIYQACSSVFYTTHSDCQKATQDKCTSNGTTGCVDLGACSSYTEAGCFYNSAGPSKDSNGKITSTGYCTYDAATTTCRDQKCSDIKGISVASLCSAQLSTCTSDGTDCITQLPCSEYLAQPACENGNGTDGLCFWEADLTDSTKSKCRIKLCSDVTDLTICPYISVNGKCVSDGSKCIAKSTCQNYTTQPACNSGGTDGQNICVWTAPATATGQGTCAVMTNCGQANNDSKACAAASYACAWTSGTTTSCAAYDCAGYQKVSNKCQYYLTFDKTNYNICQLTNNVCSAVDPNTLTVDNCYSLSKYVYSWTTSGLCQSCGTITPNNSNNSNNSNETNTNQGYLIGMAATILGYLVI